MSTINALQMSNRVLSRLWRLGIHSSEWLNERTHGWYGILAGAATQALKPEAAISAAAIAYFAIFSLFPIILLSIAIASFSIGPSMAQSLIVQRLEFIAPALGKLLENNFDEIIRARGPITIIAFLSLTWSASTIFSTLISTLTGIWGTKKSRPAWNRRGLAILFVLVFVGPILFLASFASSLMTTLITWLPGPFIHLLGGAGLVLAVILDVAFFLVLYWMLPHAASSWRGILPGAIGAGLLWELAKKAFIYFVTLYITVSNLVYGSVAVFIALLTWAYLSSWIFLFGTHLNVAYCQQKGQQQAVSKQGIQKNPNYDVDGLVEGKRTL
jgi:membrane protein